jgi:tetratricopeptide (TPR) repeat protein
MRFIHSTRTPCVLTLCSLALILSACGQKPEEAAVVEATEAAPPAAAKMPLTTSSAEARAEFETGRALLDNLHFTEARPFFERAIEQDSGFAIGHLYVAFTATTTATFVAAVGQAETNAAGASDGEQAMIAATAAAIRNDQAAQLEALSKFVSLYPKDERSHNQLANFYNGQQDYDNAILHFGHAISINPEFAAAYNSLGYAQRANGNLDAAKDAFASYVELIPDEANPYDSYAELLMEMGQYDDAIENYEKALAIDSHFVGSYAGISVAESLKGDAAAAQASAKAMLAAARTSGEKQAAMIRSITSHLFAGNRDAAIAVAEEIAAMNEAEGDNAARGGITEYMGDIMLNAGLTDEASEHYDAALSYRQQSSINDANKAQAARTHQFKSAITALVAENQDAAAELAAGYTTAVADSGTAFERRRAHELAGYLAMVAEDYEMAIAGLAQATQVNPIVLYWSARANQAAGNSDAAADLAHRAANRNVLTGNSPFARKDALMLIDQLAAGE